MASLLYWQYFIGIGAVIAISLREVDYALPVFAGVYTLFLVAITIFFTPWFSTSEQGEQGDGSVASSRILSGL